MNGKIEQWGYLATIGEGLLINFVVNFSSKPFAIVSPNTNSGAALSATKFGYSISTTGFFVSSGGDLYYEVIGY